MRFLQGILWRAVVAAAVLLLPGQTEAASTRLRMITPGHRVERVEFSGIRLESRNLPLYLAVAGGSRSNGGNVVIWHDQKQPDIRWSIERVNADFVMVRNDNSGRYLAISGASPERGANVLQWGNEGQLDILWRMEPVEGDRRFPSGCFRFQNAASRNNSRKVPQYLAVSGGSDRAGANVVQWDNVRQDDLIWCIR